MYQVNMLESVTRPLYMYMYILVHVHVHQKNQTCQSALVLVPEKERNFMQFSDQELQHIGKWKTPVHDDVLTERKRTGRHGSSGYARGNRWRKIIIISRLTRYIDSAQLCYYTVHTCIEAIMYMYVPAENTTSMNGEACFQFVGLNSALHCWIPGY